MLSVEPVVEPDEPDIVPLPDPVDPAPEDPVAEPVFEPAPLEPVMLVSEVPGLVAVLPDWF